MKTSQQVTHPTRLHQIMTDLELIAVDVENGKVMPTPENIESLFKVAQRMKIHAEAAGLEFPTTDVSSTW